jgi:hypothetical protein
MTLVRGFFNVLSPADGGERLLFRCPGCKSFHGPAIGEGGGPRWSFNGDYERPVFSPSLLVRWHEIDAAGEKLLDAGLPPADGVRYSGSDMVCHSFIGCNGAQPGQIIFLGDCTHELAGKVVDLVPWELG